MFKKQHVIITSGGTISKIDEIRHIGNFSAGTTGSLIAEKLLEKGVKVDYVYNLNAKRPFRDNLTINPENNFQEEIIKVCNTKKKWDQYKKNYTEYAFSTFEEYYDIVKKLCEKNEANAIILAAAVSDYGAEKQDGKIRSDKEELVIRLKKYPKVISQIKQWNPSIQIIGFKLLTNASKEELIEEAKKQCIANNASRVIANSVSRGNFSERSVLIFSKDGSILQINLNFLPRVVADWFTHHN